MSAILKRSVISTCAKKNVVFHQAAFARENDKSNKTKIIRVCMWQKEPGRICTCTCTRTCARAMCTDEVTRLTLRSNDRDAPILVRGRPGGRTPQVDAEASLFIGRKI